MIKFLLWIGIAFSFITAGEYASTQPLVDIMGIIVGIFLLFVLERQTVMKARYFTISILVPAFLKSAKGIDPKELVKNLSEELRKEKGV